MPSSYYIHTLFTDESFPRLSWYYRYDHFCYDWDVISTSWADDDLWSCGDVRSNFLDVDNLQPELTFLEVPHLPSLDA